MEKSITVKISNQSALSGLLIGFGTFVFMIWLAVLNRDFSWYSLIAFLIFLSLMVAYIIVACYVPTVVTADNELLQYRRVFGCKKIRLIEIKSLSCEQYSVRGTYSSTQCIRLTVSTKNGEDYEFNDIVDTSKIVDDFIENKLTDIPIVQLYNFLRENTDII